MKGNMASQAEENYLKALFTLSNEIGGKAISQIECCSILDSLLLVTATLNKK